MKEQELCELIDTFQTREDDVFLCTYPKSGTTWMQKVLHGVRREDGGETGSETATMLDTEDHFFDAIPWPEGTCTSKHKFDVAGGMSREDVDNMEDQRFFKTHASVDTFPGGYPTKAKVIYMYRNPKDVAVSLFHHMSETKTFDEKEGFSAFLDRFLAGAHVHTSRIYK